jgi:hypothetical protein
MANADVDAPYPYAVCPKRSKAYDPTTGAVLQNRLYEPISLSGFDSRPLGCRGCRSSSSSSEPSRVRS